MSGKGLQSSKYKKEEEEKYKTKEVWKDNLLPHATKEWIKQPGMKETETSKVPGTLP